MLRHIRSLLLALAPLAGAALLAASLGGVQASAAAPCWQRVIADWSDNGTVDGTYPARCYRAAMANAPTDLRIYSTIEDDLRLALQSRTLGTAPVDTPRRPSVHVASVQPSGSSATPVVAALAGGLALVGVAISAALLVASRRRRA